MDKDGEEQGNLQFMVSDTTRTVSEVMRLCGGTSNVGIGITNPSAKLHINGTTTISSTLTVDESVTLASTLNVGSELSVGKSVTLDSVLTLQNNLLHHLYNVLIDKDENDNLQISINGNVRPTINLNVGSTYTFKLASTEYNFILSKNKPISIGGSGNINDPSNLINTNDQFITITNNNSTEVTLTPTETSYSTMYYGVINRNDSEELVGGVININGLKISYIDPNNVNSSVDIDKDNNSVIINSNNNKVIVGTRNDTEKSMLLGIGYNNTPHLLNLMAINYSDK